MADSPCTGQSTAGAGKAEQAALEMYQFAALMLGDESQALQLVESTVAAVDIDPCAEPCVAKGMVRDRVLEGALALMHRQNPAAFDEPPAADPPSSCIDDDAAPPLSADELSKLIAGAGRTSFREWLSRLSQAQRAVFLQRAVLGRTNADTALAINRVSRPSLWTPEAVARIFRQALCSLASSLVQSAPGMHA